MTKIYQLLVAFFGVGLGAVALASTADAIFITNTELIHLAVNQPTMSLELPYPGQAISGLCGIEIRAQSPGGARPMRNFLAAIQISNDLGVMPVVTLKNAMTISIDLSAAAGGYGAWFSIQTKDGTSLSDVIRRTLGESRPVVVVGTSCN